jgi:hypothetical protein
LERSGNAGLRLEDQIDIGEIRFRLVEVRKVGLILEIQDLFEIGKVRLGLERSG